MKGEIYHDGLWLFAHTVLILGVLIFPIILLGIWLFDKGAQKKIFSTFPSAQNTITPPSDRLCSHCGTHLRANWSHCPQCGAVTE